MSPEFRSDFESGNGIYFREVGEGVHQFEIRPDTGSEDMQWFHFIVSGARGRTLEFQLLNTNKTNMPGHWSHAWPVASADGGREWKRTSGPRRCDHDKGVYTFSHTFSRDEEVVAYHHPYTHSDVLKRLDDWSAHKSVKRVVIGNSVENRRIEMLTVSEGNGKDAGKRLGFWVCARQHSAETPASFVMDGFMDFVLSDDRHAVALRRGAVINSVPMINPDGVVAGNYRDNIVGVNLNRVWNSPTLEESPEVVAVTDAVRRWVDAGNRFDFFIDFHADSGARDHYAFHPSRDQIQQLDNWESYYSDSVRYLNMVAKHSSVFIPGRGLSFSDHHGVSYQYMRKNYGVLSLTPEGGYSVVSHGERAGEYLTPDHHRAVGRAFAIALAEFYQLV